MNTLIAKYDKHIPNPIVYGTREISFDKFRVYYDFGQTGLIQFTPDDLIRNVTVEILTTSLMPSHP